MSDWENLKGLIPLVVGIYLFLVATGKLPRNPRDPERMALWRRKFGPLVKVLTPFMVAFGLLQLIGVL